MTRRAAIAAIDQAGALLVFPLDNRKEPASLWSRFFPRRKMRWEWDEAGDDAVAELWQLRGELSTTRKVVYTKWFRGRATYFSRPLFTALLRALNPQVGTSQVGGRLSEDARRILGILEGESPVSTKELKRMSGLQGRENERAYEKALRELWSRLLIVAFGEVEEGAFPSLAVGATRVLFEDLWAEAFRMDPRAAEKTIDGVLSRENLFRKHFEKLREPQQGAVAARRPARGGGQDEAPGSSGKGRVPSVVRFEDL